MPGMNLFFRLTHGVIYFWHPSSLNKNSVKNEYFPRKKKTLLQRPMLSNALTESVRLITKTHALSAILRHFLLMTGARQRDRNLLAALTPYSTLSKQTQYNGLIKKQ
ncbi:hypothetical protein [Pantoea allii]|uniref:hypothetical protein n=1 Tax=Pantoea allii TaxID=574096 RepID=UPI000A23C505|nr:hypothetical protein [Pantoea allii]MBW1254448.1 hypothetical protein [Pantoea allii]MBW1263575.1 hypothetical protein [Pantoea allii]MBW1285644.1 hypothetical protein [Pantoea allii]ORM86985.1 hypothetical protein HA38_07040 [Pantoea allii]PBK01337.1 hypothetical protein CMR03_05355 [Pantoea allii]